MCGGGCECACVYQQGRWRWVEARSGWSECAETSLIQHAAPTRVNDVLMSQHYKSIQIWMTEWGQARGYCMMKNIPNQLMHTFNNGVHWSYWNQTEGTCFLIKSSHLPVNPFPLLALFFHTEINRARSVECTVETWSLFPTGEHTTEEYWRICGYRFDFAESWMRTIIL